jgi:hypothetical protein
MAVYPRLVVFLQLDVPQLRDVLQIVGGHPDALLRHGVLLAKIGFTLVDEEHRVGLAIEAGEVEFLNLGGQSRSRGCSSWPPPPLSDEDDLSFMVAMSAFTVDSSDWNDFIISMRSLMVGSVIVVEWSVEAVEVDGDGEGLERVGEDLRDTDTRLSSASAPNDAGPRLRNF